MITRELLESKIAEFQDGKDRAMAEANSYSGAIQALLQLVAILDDAEQKETENIEGKEQVKT